MNKGTGEVRGIGEPGERLDQPDVASTVPSTPESSQAMIITMTIGWLIPASSTSQ